MKFVVYRAFCYTFFQPPNERFLAFAIYPTKAKETFLYKMAIFHTKSLFEQFITHSFVCFELIHNVIYKHLNRALLCYRLV